jgi:glutamate racemase
VPLVETGESQSEGADYFIKRHVENLLAKDSLIDTIILGCTHYPLLLDKIRKYVPEGINIISQGEYVAASLKVYMVRHPEMDMRCTKGGSCRYYTTESVETFLPNASIFLNSVVDAESLSL